MQEIEFSYRLGLIETYVHHNDIVCVIYETPGSISKTFDKAIRGKIRVLEKHETIMPPIEAAWWYYNIALEYIAVRKIKEARFYLKKSIAFESRPSKRIVLLFLKLFMAGNKLAGWLVVKPLSVLYMLNFPELVKHEIITGD